MLISITFVTLCLYAIECAYRRVFLYDTGQLGTSLEMAYEHQVVIFLGSLLLLILAQHVVGAPRWQRVIGLAMAPVTMFALLVTERRAGFIALIVAFLAYSLVFLVTHRKAFFFIALPVLVGFSIYLPVFWNTPGLLGQPARAVRSITEPDARDAASNSYRELEKINVRATIQADPLLGVGFGREFLFVVPLPSLEFWEFWRYEPHHNILWVWLKTGAGGFVLFWVLMCTSLVHAARSVRTLESPETRAFALLALGGIILTLVYCWVDLGLVSGRVTVFLGTLIGVLAVLGRIQEGDMRLADSDLTRPRTMVNHDHR